MSKLHDNNYFNVQSFMVKDLKLKGNELVIFAVIYGFSQTEDQAFTGGLQYLADWTNSTKQGVIKSLKSLLEKGYIIKSEKHINGVKFCEYRSTMFNGEVNKVEQEPLNNVEQGIKQSLPNKELDNKSVDNLYIKNIVEYLNSKADKNYRPTTESTARHIRARLNEGFSVDDFFAVIDKKVAEWKGTDMDMYLRPETLFGSKFESYLNARSRTTNRRGANGVLIADNGYDELDEIF